MRKIILGILILLCGLFIIVEMTPSVEAETDPERFVCLETLGGYSGVIAYSENNQWLASGITDHTIKIWNTSDWSEIKTLAGHSDWVETVDFSKNNKWLVSGSDDDTIKIWDTSDWSEIQTLTGHSDNVKSVDFSENNKWLASGSRDYTIKIWSEKEQQDWIVTGQEIRTNETIILDGNLIIENGGNLTFRNVTLIMNCSEDGGYGIVVNEGGKFHILDYDNSPETKYDRSNITANDKEFEFKFLVNSSSEFVMKNSELSECGYTGQGEEDGRDGLTIKTNNTIIINSSFYNSNVGIYYRDTSNNQNINNHVYNNDRGIYLEYSNNNTITNNTVYSNDGYGIYLKDSSNNQIQNTTVYSNNASGIRLYLKSKKNKITNNLIYSNYYDGISLSSQCKYNQITDNNIYSNNDMGIFLDISSNNNITNNNVSDNSNYGIGFGSSSNNQIINNTISGNKEGIFHYSSTNNQIINSTVSNSIRYDFYLNGNSDVTAINTTFNKNQVHIDDEDSELIVKWYLSIKVLDKNHSIVQDANIQIQDNENGTFDENYKTDSEGFVKWVNLTEYIKNKNDGKTYYTPYKVTTEKDNLKNITYIKIDQSKEITIILREINHWIVTGQEIRVNETIILDGNLTIENGGNLTFRNVTLIMNCFEEGEFGIEVKDGGKFYIFDYDNNPETKYDRSNITSNNKEFEFKFLVDSGSEFEMRNSELSECGYDMDEDGRAGLTIKTDNTIIENSSFYNNYCALYLRDSNNTKFENNSVYSNNHRGIYLFEANNNKIRDNNISNNGQGISLIMSSNNNKIINNNVSTNVRGIYLTYSSNNNKITNNSVSYNKEGIYLRSSSINNDIINNEILFNGQRGIYLQSSSNNQIINNFISKNNKGIEIDGSKDIKMMDNNIENNKYNFDIYSNAISEYYNNVDISNKINGKPIYYIKNQSNLLFDVSMKIGYLGLISCYNVTIKNLTLSNNSQGILFVNTTDSLIDNCTIKNNSVGIHLHSSHNNTITNNTINKNNDGINLYYSSNNNITNNNFNLNNGCGIELYKSRHIQIINNTIFDSSRGIDMGSSIKTIIINNSASNCDNGILFYNSTDNLIINSSISGSTEFDLNLISNSRIITINTTFNKNNVEIEDEDSEITVKWYLHLKVVDGDNVPIPNTRVIIEDLKGWEIYNDKTGLDGWSRWIVCTEYVQTQSGSTFYTNHTINIEDNGYLLNTKSIKMNESKSFVIQPKTYNFFIECDKPIGYTNPGELTVYEIKIINKGLENDIIYLEIDNPSNWLAYLNSYHVILSSNEEKIIYLTVEPGEDEVEGETSIIGVKGTSNGNVNTFDLFQVETTVNFVHDIEITQNLLEDNIDPGKSIKYEIQLENLGNGDEDIDLIMNNSQSDEVGDWIINELVPLEIKIGKSGTTNVTITPPSFATANEQKKYVFDIFSDDIYLGSFTTITTVNQTHDIEIQCDNNEESGKPSETVTYVLNITNNGNAEYTYYLELSGENIDWCDLSDTYISLKSNNYTEIYLNVSIPNNAKAWEKANITMNVLSLDRTEKYNSINIITYVSQIFDLKLETENKEIFVEPGKDFEFDVTIENLGNGVDNITLSISGIPKGWTIEPKTINTFIDSESSITKSIKITIPENALVNEIANLVFTIKSNNYGDFVLDYMNLTAYVNQNYEIEIKCSTPEKEVIIGESEEYKIEVENKGNGQDTIMLKLSGLNTDWAYLSESVVILEAGESKNISLYVKSPSEAIEGENSIINVIGISKNGNYSIPLTITTTLKAVDYTPPKADFKITLNNKEVTKVRIGELVTFDASSTSEEEAEIVEYRWDFDNGDIRYDEKVDYTYPKDTEPGEYTITLTVTDSNGVSTEKQMTIEVSEEEEEKNWLLYLILIILVVIGILIVIMLNKVVKNLRNLGKVEKPITPISEKSDTTFLKEEQKRKEIEMWKPLEEKPEPLIKVEEEKMEEEKEKVKESEEKMEEEKEKAEEKAGEADEFNEEEKDNTEESIEGEEEKEIINEDDFWKKLKKEAESEDDREK